MLKIDFLIVDTPYSTTGHFAQDFSRALERAEVQVRVLPFVMGTFYETLTLLWKDPPDMTCSFADITLGQGVPFGAQWSIPHVTLLIDPALYFLHHLQGPNSWITSVDEADIKLLQRRGAKKVAFLPHATSKELLLDSSSQVERERPFSLVFFGTCIDPEEIAEQWALLFSPEERNLLYQAAEIVLYDPYTTPLEALLQLGVGEVSTQIIDLHYALDLYVRGKERLELIKALNDFPITIWGGKLTAKGWAELLKGEKNVTLYPALTFEQSLKVMQQSKIVLNSSIRLKQGSHERLFYGAACGAMPLTAHHSFVENHFREALSYTYGQWEPLKERVASLLQNPNQLHRQVSLCQQKTLAEHTWDQRVKTLTKMID